MATLAGIAYVDVRYDPASVQRLRKETDLHGRSIVSSLGGAGRVAGRALALGIGVGTAAAGYGLVKAIGAAADFQKQLNILQAVSGATADQMRRIQTESIALGRDMRLPATSAQDAALAMTELAKGGLSVRDSMHAARGALELAVAGQTDVGNAASITATSLNQFGLAGTQATHVADLLAGAANASAGNVTDFADGLKYAGTAAHAAGQSIDATVGALAEMANKGLQGSVAGSSLAQAFRSLQAPTAKAQAALDKYGISIYDAAGKTKPLVQISDEFAAKLGNLTQKQQNATLAQIFGSRAVQAARVVLLGGGDALQQYVDKVGKSGNAQRLAAAQMKGFSGAIQGFTSNIETLGIQLGLVLLPAATKVVRELSSLTSVVANVAGAKTPRIAFQIAWQGIDKVYTSLKDALFGQVQSLGSQGLSAGAAHGIRLPIQVDKKGLVPQLGAAISGAVSGVNWTTVGVRIGSAIGSAIKFTTAAAGKIVSTFTTAILAHSNQIADAGAKIAAELVANLLDPAFWAKNWKTFFAIGAASLPVEEIFGIGARIGLRLGEGLTSVFLRVAARLPGFLQRGIGAAVRIGEGLFARLGDRAFAELQHAISRAPGLVQRFIGAAIRIGQQAFARLSAFITSSVSGAITRVGDRIQSTLVGRTVAWIGKFAIARSAISALAGAFNAVIAKIEEAIHWVENLAGKIAAIHVPSFSLPSVRSLIPHTGGLVTPMGGLAFAGGGVAYGGVPGRDSVPAMLTPGEVVLNQSQQMALLHGGMGGGDIYISIDGRILDERVDYRVERRQRRTARTVKAGRKWEA